MIKIGGTGILSEKEYEVIEARDGVFQCSLCDLFKSCNLCFESVDVFGHCHAGLRDDKKFVFFKKVDIQKEEF